MNRFNKIHEMFASRGIIGARMNATSTLYISREDLENNRELYESKYLVTRVKGRWYVGGFPVPEKDVSLFYNQGLDLVNIGAAKLWLKNHEDEVRLELFFRDKKMVVPRSLKRRLIVIELQTVWHRLSSNKRMNDLFAWTLARSWLDSDTIVSGNERQYLLSTNNRGIGEFPRGQDWSELDIFNPYIKF